MFQQISQKCSLIYRMFRLLYATFLGDQLQSELPKLRQQLQGQDGSWSGEQLEQKQSMRDPFSFKRCQLPFCLFLGWEGHYGTIDEKCRYFLVDLGNAQK